AHRMIKLLDRFDKMPRETFNETAVEIVGDDRMNKLTAVIDSTTLHDLPEEILTSDAVKPLAQLLKVFRDIEIDNVVYDVRLMRGFDYYTGIVFEAFDEAPQNRRAMFGGGRYDGLVAMFGVEPLPVVGVAPGETMLREFLLAHNLMPDVSGYVAPDVIVVPMVDVDDAGSIANIVADTIRGYGFKVAVDYTDRKLDKKTKAAVKQGAGWIVYVGQEEIDNNMFALKNIESGEQVKMPMEELADYISDYVIKQVEGIESK
ncbi:MAG: ATP phosphoribosyltransferase regulatory subunit, partial [Candidatus Saccharibacteria bacterium]|nr:ATP phosphoribosyltransferase regulatory subunit [Candidatus Saccharibacteria bacterium]